MSELNLLSERLLSGQDLDPESAAGAARLLSAEDESAADKKVFLKALAAKGESVPEVVAFAKVFRELALDPQLQDWAERGIDIVGTGGSGSGGYNISSVTAFTLAAAGVPVLKHGNRAITSQSGSADFMTMAGITVQSDPQKMRLSLEALNFCFFFAPAFHPAFKHIMPVRKELAEEGQKTIFNILGPLINPAKPKFQLLGVFAESWVKPLAAVLGDVGVKRGFAVHCQLSDGKPLDELSSAGLNHLVGIGEMHGQNRSFTAEGLGFISCPPSEVKGGSAEENWHLLEDILEGRGRPGLLDSLCLNVAAALVVVQKVENLELGLALARETILGGALRDWLKQAREFYQTLAI